MKLNYLYLILFFSAFKIFANNTFPYEVETVEIFDGGKLLVDYSNTKPSFYLIKLNIADFSDVIYHWEGKENKTNKISTTINGKIYLSKIHVNILFLIILDNNQLYLQTMNNKLEVTSKLPLNIIPGEFDASDFNILNSEEDSTYCQIGKSLFRINFTQNIIEKISNEKIISAKVINNSNYIITIASDGNILNIYNKNFELIKSKFIEIFDKVKIYETNEFIVVITSSEYQSNSLIQLFEKRDFILKYVEWVNAKPYAISCQSIKNSTLVSYVKFFENSYILEQISFSLNSHTPDITYLELPKNLISHTATYIQSGNLFLVFKNSIIMYNEKINSIDFLPIGAFIITDYDVNVNRDLIILASSNSSVLLHINENNLWFLNRMIANSWEILFPIVTLLIIFIFIQLYRHQKRLLVELLDLPSSGTIFVIDNSGRLTRANSAGKKLLSLNNNIPMKKLFSYYCNNNYTHEINEMIKNGMDNKESITQRLNLKIDINIKEWMCSIIVLRNLTGQFRGLVFTGIDITEQLERKRLSNWAQLAHDMQTNLSTIRLNAETLDVNDNQNNVTRQKKIIHQVNLLIQRVRDIVTVGRSDVLEKSSTDSLEIVNSVRNEFDELMFPNITFEVITDEFTFECDKAKLIRAIRNAVENAIKAFQGKPGKIYIIANKENRKFRFIIKDNGPGMSEEIKAKMLTPFFTTASNIGGSGIGTMIMQRVIELHGGSITINSQINNGTEVIFEIPIGNIKSKNKNE